MTKEQQKDQDYAVYWDENKINIVNNQLISTYTEKGLEKNSKYLAVGRIAGKINFLY